MQPEFPPVPQQPFQPQYPPGPATQPVSASSLRARKPLGLIITIVLLTLLLFGAAGFGVWAWTQAEDYKKNVDEKVSAQVGAAVKAAEDAKEAGFLEREKEPLKGYTGPSAFGSVGVKYPKTWAAYVDESGKGSDPVVGYFHPRYVPGVDSDTAFALKVEVLESSYDKELKKFDGQAKKGEVRISPIKAKNNERGVRIDGAIAKDRTGSVVMFRLRDKTLKLTTFSTQFTKDFNGIILENLTFTP